jgi:alpha-glucosidase
MLARMRSSCAMVAALLVLMLAPAAGADVTVSTDRVVVDTRGARAIVDRSPFRIAFQTGHGRTVLREVANRPRPRRIPPTDDPEPFGLERAPDHAVYGPLTFEVGRAERAQWFGSYWAGNLLFDRHRGTMQAARRVEAVRADGAGVRLVVATTDPARDLVVRIRPDRGATTLRLTATPTSARGVIAMGDSFATGSDEAFRGFGGRHWGVDQRGHKLYGWIEQENVGGPATLGATTLLPGFVEQGAGRTLASLGNPDLAGNFPGGPSHYLFPGGPGGAYAVQHQFVSSRPYAFLLNRDELSRWRMATDRHDAWQVQSLSPSLDYTVAVGRPRAAMAAVSAVTGRHLLPPAWAQGPILSRVNQNTGGQTPETYRAKIEADLADIERLHPPISAYAFEGWGLLNDDAYVRRAIERLHAMGLRALLYVRAFVADDALRTQSPGDVDDVTSHHLVAAHPDGSPYAFQSVGAQAYLLDFSNPAARAWFRARVDRMLGLGADGFMEDFGEQVLDGMRFHDGSTGAQMHNRYPVLYHRTGRAAVDAYERGHRGRHIWFFTRAGFSGRPGSEAYVQGNFPGDETVDWSAASGLASLTPDMLNRAVGGSFGYTTDIGGYVDLLTGPTDAELFTRWSEWSALTPYFRVHNSPTTGERMPWSFDPQTYDRWVAMARLHQRAQPLIRRLWRAGRRTGIPPVRPLWLEFAGDRRAAQQDQEWMLGGDVLVAPVVTQGAARRDLYVPRGCWTRPDTGERVRGPGSRAVAAPLGRLPYFFRCGTKPF